MNKRWLACGILLAFGTGCKPDTSNPNPTNAPASYTYTDPRNNQQITIINDGTSTNPFPGDAVMTQSLEAIPLMQLQGMTTIHYSDWTKEIADNIYNHFSTADQNAWNTLVASMAAADKDSSLQEFENFYGRYLTEPSIGDLDDLIAGLKQGNPTLAGEELFMMSQFVDLSNHEIVGYVGSPMYSSFFNLLLVPQFFSINGNLLSIGSSQFNLGVINGQPAIVGVQGKAVTPFVLPSVFLTSIGTPAVAPINQAEADVSAALRSGQILTASSGETFYVSPNSPDVYRPVTAQGVENDLALESQQLKTNPDATFLHGKRSAVDHGFTDVK